MIRHVIAQYLYINLRLFKRGVSFIRGFHFYNILSLSLMSQGNFSASQKSKQKVRVPTFSVHRFCESLCSTEPPPLSELLGSPEPPWLCKSLLSFLQCRSLAPFFPFNSQSSSTYWSHSVTDFAFVQHFCSFNCYILTLQVDSNDAHIMHLNSQMHYFPAFSPTIIEVTLTFIFEFTLPSIYFSINLLSCNYNLQYRISSNYRRPLIVYAL